MTQVNLVNKIPEDFFGRFSPYAQWELDNAGDAGIVQLFRHSDFVCAVRADDGTPLMLAGVLQISLLGTAPELWIMLTTEVETAPRRYIRQIRHLVSNLREVFPRMRTKLEAKEKNCRFAEIFGFRFTGREEDNYLVYEV